MVRASMLALFLAAVVRMGSVAEPPQSLVVGAVLFQADALVWPVGQYEKNLEADLDLLPVSPQFPEERLPTPEALRQPPVDILVREAATASEQVLAVEELLAMGIDGLLIMPAADDEALRAALQQALDAGIPVVMAHRKLEGLSSPRIGYAGLAHGQLGYAIGRGALGVTANGAQKYPLLPEHQFVVLTQNPSDPIERDLAAGFERAAAEHLAGVYATDAEGSYALAQALIGQMPDLTSIFLTNRALIPGVLQAVREVATPGEHVRVVSYGAPQDYKALIERDVLNGIVGQDYYGSFLKGLLQLKAFILEREPLRDEYVPVELRLTFHLPYGTFTRYPYESPFGFDLLFMWWLG